MRHNTSKSGLFLMELLLSILFFSLAGVVCIQMFVRSHLISKESVELNHAVEQCQNIAECFYGCNGDIAEITALLNHCYPSVDTDSFVLLFNDAFKPVIYSEKEIVRNSVPDTFSYYITVNLSAKEDFTYCHISAYKNSSSEPDKKIYELDNSLFMGTEIQNGK